MGIIDELKEIFNMSESKRRSRLGVGVAKWEENQPWYLRNPLADWLGDARSEKKDGGILPDKLVTQFGDEDGKISLKDQYLLQRNGKKALAMRSVESGSVRWIV